MIDYMVKQQVLMPEAGHFMVIYGDASMARVCGDCVADVGPAVTVGLSC